jgi:hypothetical protein
MKSTQIRSQQSELCQGTCQENMHMQCRSWIPEHLHTELLPLHILIQRVGCGVARREPQVLYASSPVLDPVLET